MTGSCVVAGLRVTHREASAADVAAACAPDPVERIDALLEAGAAEAFVLHTCNRAEAYAVAEDERAARRACGAVSFNAPDDVVVRTGHEASLRHLLRVAAGLESVVPGEHQVLGQVREAFQQADDAGAVGDVLERAVLKAIHLGERARDETAIDEGPTSLAAAAVRHAVREHQVGHALIVGAGEMGERAARAFASRGVTDLTLVNRTRSRAEELAADLDRSARVARFDRLPAAFEWADAAITATDSEEPVVDAAALADAGRTAVVDLGQPGDVAPAARNLDEVDVHDPDDLASSLAAARESRAEAEAAVEAMVDDALEQLLERFKRARVDEVVAAMHEGGERIKRAELEKALAQLESHGTLTDEQREDVEALADALVSKLLAPPTESLRAAAADDDWETVATAIQLFDPALAEDPGRLGGGQIDGSLPREIETDLD